jgi:hypothetical protein
LAAWLLVLVLLVLLVVRELRPFKRHNTYYVWDGMGWNGDDQKLFL